MNLPFPLFDPRVGPGQAFDLEDFVYSCQAISRRMLSVGKANTYMAEDNSDPDDMDGADDEEVLLSSKRKTSMIR